MITVAIVDDDFMVARIHTGFVERVPGFAPVGSAHDATSALALVDQHKPDLVLLDIHLPDRSGLELLPELRRLSPETDVMIISAAREADTIRNTVRQGVVDYLLKPFTLADLTARLEAYAQRRRSWSRVSVTDQEDIDRVVHGGREEAPTRLPKGLSAETVDLVRAALETHSDLSATEAGELVGISRVSARRYLEWLAESGRAEVQLRYGAQGRPERRFRRPS